jgi:hypothetical protein
MLEQDIYTRRFKAKAESKGYSTEGLETEIEAFRLAEVTPSLAVAKQFSKMRLKTQDAEEQFQNILESVCEVCGLDPSGIETGDSNEWRDVKSISCVIAVLDKDIRPHTVMRKALGLKYNSMVNHYVDRSKKREELIMYHNNLKAARVACAD